MTGQQHKVMIVTGGARGIGAAVCERAASEGFDVCVNYNVRADRADALVEKIRKIGRKAISVRADVADERAVSEMFVTVDRNLGAVTALVNNAGIDYESPFMDVEAEKLDRVIRVNVHGTMLCAREAVRRMAKSRGGPGGTIVNVGSISTAIGGTPGDLVYTTTKGAIESFTRGLAIEVGRDGVRVNCVRPGATRTEIFDNNEFGLDHVMELVQQRVALGRMAQPEEIAAMIVWLSTPSASYATGGVFDVTGGLF